MKSIEDKIFDQIIEWETKAGESFNDYFSHDSINDVSWAMWLLGKGYKEHATKIIVEINAGNRCIDQNVLYELKPVSEYADDLTREEVNDNFTYNMKIMAEFLAATDTYRTKFNNFIKDY